MELNICSQAVSELYLLAGDVIFDTTSKTQGMYFVASGFGVYFHWSEFEAIPRKEPTTRRGSGRIKWIDFLHATELPKKSEKSNRPVLQEVRCSL